MNGAGSGRGQARPTYPPWEEAGYTTPGWNPWRRSPTWEEGREEEEEEEEHHHHHYQEPRGS